MFRSVLVIILLFVSLLAVSQAGDTQNITASHIEQGQKMVALQGIGHENTDHHGDPAWWFITILVLQCVSGAWLTSRHFFIKTNGDYQPALTALQIFSAFLLMGTLVAQLWVHGDPPAYHATMHHELFTLNMHGFMYSINLHFLVNDLFMAFFFGIAAKELCEAIFKKEGSLRGMRGLLPGLACLGGVLGPMLVYKLLSTEAQADAWAVPCATDIAFAWLGARMVWGGRHPAVIFLLALAIGDDFIGMGIIAAFYPQNAFHPMALVYLGGGIALAWLFRRLAYHWECFRSWIPYAVICAPLCWLGLLLAGLHAALALVFVVPFMPMAGRDEGIFAPGQSGFGQDTVNRFEHAFKPFVDVGLFAFGLANAGVVWIGEPAWNQDSWAVFLGLGIGKTVGITLFTIVGCVVLRLRMPIDAKSGVAMVWQDVPVIGILGSMGFTVALFVADAAGGDAGLKLGALASVVYLVIGIAIGKRVCKPMATD